ncbi:MAG: PAS domain-containing protein [Actinomycetes bacterium]
MTLQPVVSGPDARRPGTSNRALLGIGRDGCVTAWSAGAVELLGFPADSMIGRPLASIAVAPATPTRVADMRQEVLAGAEVVAENRRLRCADGRTIEVEITVFPLLDAAGRVSRVDLLFTPVPDDEVMERGDEVRDRIDRVAAAHRLDATEVRILHLLGHGHRVPTIARRLHLAPGTVRNRLSALYAKVGVTTQVELIEVLVGERDASGPGVPVHGRTARSSSG